MTAPMLPGRIASRWLVVSATQGTAVELGSEVVSIHGEVGVFVGVTRGPEVNGVAQVAVTGPDGGVREEYARVWGLTVRRGAA